MIAKQIEEKGILAKLLEKGIEIFLKKECKKIGKIKIDIAASSTQVIKGIIKKIHIIAEDINYKDLLFDKIELEANDINIIFNLHNKELNFKNNFSIQFKISLSENSLKTILLSNNWNWIGAIISKEIFNQDKLEDISIKNDQIIITTSKEQTNDNKGGKVSIMIKKGKLYLESKENSKFLKIPIEDKVFIEKININNNLINIYAKSSVSL